MKHDKTIEPRRSGRFARRRMAMILASLGIVASLLMSCGEADREVNLALLEWKGYEDLKYYPEYNAKYGRQPEYTLPGR